MKDYKLLLKNPAYEWENATPVGSGNLGAMIYGTIASERIQLNEEKIWSSEEGDTAPSDFREKIDHIRMLFLEGKETEVDEWATDNLGNEFRRIKSYETAGELHLDIHENDFCENYTRVLDLINGTADINYSVNGINYNRTIIASYPDNLIAVKLNADKKGMINFSARYERDNIKSYAIENDAIVVKAHTIYGGHEFTVKILFDNTNGEIINTNGKLYIKNADSCNIYIFIAAECEPFIPYDLSWEKIYKRHTDDFSAIMKRSEIVLCGGSDIYEKYPLDERLANIKKGITDLGYIELYYQFGKYLLVSSSRKNTLPANLQGVWNGYYEAPWNCDYHTNINLQMNYWHAEAANISECTQALFDYLNNYLLEAGKETANKYYNCRGTICHHLSDIYGFTSPADGLWGLWPLGSAWLCYHLWEHYLYTLDKNFLKNTAYDFISENVRFFLDYMFEDKNNMLMTGPSTSPENRYISNGKKIYLAMSPTMDIEIIGGLLKFYIETEKILNINNAQALEAETALGKMPRLQIGKHGQLMEWLYDYDEAEPGHRHISHMFAVYPGSAVNTDTPELMNAARTTLERRLAHGGGHTGWSCAWLIALFARMQNGEEAFDMIKKLFSQSTKENMFDIHPPFQIDGNFGACAAIIEMVLQSHNGVISILPAIPECFKNGSFSGLMARGGVEVAAVWENGGVKNIKLSAKNDCSFILKYNGKSQNIILKANEVLEI